MGVHAAMGCCAHHSHSCETGCQKESKATRHQCEHEHGHAKSTENGELSYETDHESSHHSHQCDGEHCKVARTDAGPDLGFLKALPSTQDSLLFQEAFFFDRAVSNWPDSAQLSSRMHIAPCVWII